MNVREASIVIGPAEGKDASPCNAVLSDWAEETAWMPRLGETMQEARYLRNLITRGWITVARQKGRVVGFLVRDGAEIHALYLSQRMRRQGIGKALLDHAKRQQTQLALWTYEANKPAQLFYLREGFHEIARSDGADNDEGLPDIRYEWRMSNG